MIILKNPESHSSQPPPSPATLKLTLVCDEGPRYGWHSFVADQSSLLPLNLVGHVFSSEFTSGTCQVKVGDNLFTFPAQGEFQFFVNINHMIYLYVLSKPLAWQLMERGSQYQYHDQQIFTLPEVIHCLQLPRHSSPLTLFGALEDAVKKLAAFVHLLNIPKDIEDDSLRMYKEFIEIFHRSGGQDLSVLFQYKFNSEQGSEVITIIPAVIKKFYWRKRNFWIDLQYQINKERKELLICIDYTECLAEHGIFFPDQIKLPIEAGLIY